MKIEDWSKLEELGFKKVSEGKWRRGSNTYIYKESCEGCGNPFIGCIKSRYCSKECLHKNFKYVVTEDKKKRISNSLKNRKHSEEHNKRVSKSLKKYYKDNNSPFLGKKHKKDSKKKIGDAHRGKNISKETRKKLSDALSGEKHPNHGKHLSKETRKRIGDANKGKCGLKGEKSPSWKGGYNSKGIPTYDTYAPRLEWCEEVRRNPDDPNVLEVRCVKCHKWYIPSLRSVWNRTQVLKGNKGYRGEQRFYCSEACKHACSIYGKSPETLMRQDAVNAGDLGWIDLGREVQKELRDMVLARDNYTCLKCGLIDKTGKKLQCHHIKPASVDPLESADLDNCRTYCIDCHHKAHEKDGCRYYQLRMEICY